MTLPKRPLHNQHVNGDVVTNHIYVYPYQITKAVPGICPDCEFYGRAPIGIEPFICGSCVGEIIMLRENMNLFYITEWIFNQPCISLAIYDYNGGCEK